MALTSTESRFIPDSAKGIRNRLERHSHLEGSHFPSQLFKIADDLEIPLSQSARHQIQDLFDQAVKNSHSSGEKSLTKFIARLSTRWMRLLHAKILLLSETPEKAVAWQKRLQKALVLTDLEQKYKIQGLEFTNMLFSPFNMTGMGGNLSFTYLPGLLAGSLINEEKDTYQGLLDRYSAHRGSYIKSTIHWMQYTHLISEVAAEVEQRALKEGRTFKVLKTISLRRNDLEIFFLQANPEESFTAGTVAHILHRLFSQNVIDAVDISGVESEELYSLDKMSEFLKELKRRHVFITVHAGELNYNTKRPLARKNLEAVQNLEAVRMVAHGNRLLDDRNDDLFKESERQQQILLLNLLSNFSSGVSGAPDLHPGIKKMPKLVNSSLPFVFTTDDHIATYTDGQHEGKYLEAEQAIAVDSIMRVHPHLFSLSSLEDYLDGQAYNAQQLLFTNLEDQRLKSQNAFNDEKITSEQIVVLPRKVDRRACV